MTELSTTTLLTCRESGMFVECGFEGKSLLESHRGVVTPDFRHRGRGRGRERRAGCRPHNSGNGWYVSGISVQGEEVDDE